MMEVIRFINNFTGLIHLVGLVVFIIFTVVVVRRLDKIARGVLVCEDHLEVLRYEDYGGRIDGLARRVDDISEKLDYISRDLVETRNTQHADYLVLRDRLDSVVAYQNEINVIINKSRDDLTRCIVGLKEANNEATKGLHKIYKVLKEGKTNGQST